jgi:putative hydrolase of the HAD superfamily
MEKIEAVIFDVGGVLHESCSAAMWEDLVRELDLDQQTVEQIQTHQMPLLVEGTIDEAQFWLQISKTYGIRQVDVSENLLGRAFAAALKPYLSVQDLVKELKSNGITVAILSNTIEPHARANRAAGVYDGFDHVLLSYEIGLSKPSADIFNYALQILGAAPSTTIMVDDLKENVVAAEALGMTGVLFTDPDTTIAQLRALALN